MNNLILEYCNYNKNRVIFKKIKIDIEKKKYVNKAYSFYNECHYVPCVSFTSYLNEKIRKQYYNIDKNIANQMNDQDNALYFANAFSEFITNFLNSIYQQIKQFNNISIEDFKKQFFILPCVSSDRERTYLKFKELFELISEKTGVSNGYKFVCNKKNSDIPINKMSDTLFTKNIAVNLYEISRINKKYKLIFIDDVIRTGNTFNKFAKRVFNNSSAYEGKFLMFLNYAQVFDETSNRLGEYNKINESIITEKCVGCKNDQIKNGFYKTNENFFTGILLSAHNAFNKK